MSGAKGGASLTRESALNQPFSGFSPNEVPVFCETNSRFARRSQLALFLQIEGKDGAGN
jgi:hypothetical protein